MTTTPAPPTRRSSTPRVTGTTQSPDLGKGQPGAPGVPPKKKKKRVYFRGGSWVFGVTNSYLHMQALTLPAIRPRQVRRGSSLLCYTVVAM